MSTLAPINFTRGVPANESFPIDDLIESAAMILKQQGAAILQYGPALGFAPLREWIAQWQGVAPDQVLLGNGSLEIVEFLTRSLVNSGDVVYTESPSYDRAITTFKKYGARVVGVPLEADGPDIASLESELKKHAPKFFYLIPDFQNPAGATCSLEKRKRLIALAEQYNFWIVEDAPYRLLRYRGNDEPTLFSLAPHRVLHLGSFTKLIAPGVRAGYMIGDSKILQGVAKLAEEAYISPGYMAHGITYQWCKRGLLIPQIEKLKQLYAPRLQACLTAIDTHLPGAKATRPDGGFFISLTLPEGVMTTAVRHAAAKRNLNLADGLAFFPNGGGERFLRLPFCALTPELIDEGVRRLAESVKDVS